MEPLYIGQSDAVTLNHADNGIERSTCAWMTFASMTLYFGWLWFSVLVSICCMKLPQFRLRTALIMIDSGEEWSASG